MTQEKWIEDVFNYAASIGKFSLLHELVDEVAHQHPNISYVCKLEKALSILEKNLAPQVDIVQEQYYICGYD